MQIKNQLEPYISSKIKDLIKKQFFICDENEKGYVLQVNKAFKNTSKVAEELAKAANELTVTQEYQYSQERLLHPIER